MKYSSHAGSRRAQRNIYSNQIKSTIRQGEMISETFSSMKLMYKGIVVVVNKFDYKVITTYRQNNRA